MTFYTWAINNGYKDGLVLSRKDKKLNFSPENCEFISRGKASRNKASSRVITIDGITKNWIDWCRAYNLPESTVRNRMNRGMSIKEALTTPVKRKNKK